MFNWYRQPAKATLTISYSFLGIAFFLLLFLVAVIRIIDYRMGLGIKLSEYISMCSFGCITIGLLYNAVSLQYNFAVTKLKFEKQDEAIKIDKIRFTYQVTSDWFKADMAMNAERARRFMLPYKGELQKTEKLAEFKQKLDQIEGLEIRKSLTANLNYFENLSLLLADGVIEEEILKKCFKTTFATYYDNLKEFIEDVQRGNSGGNSKIFMNFVALCKKWNES